MRWAGKLGFTQQTEIKPGVWEDVITAVDARGELKQRTEALDTGDEVLPQYRTTTSVSVLSDGRWDPTTLAYLTNAGRNWTPGTVVHEYPRVTIYIGEEYRGPLAEPVPDDA